MILTYIQVIPVAFLISFVFLTSLFPSLCPATVNIPMYSHKPTISERWMASMRPILQVRKLTQRGNGQFLFSVCQKQTWLRCFLTPDLLAYLVNPVAHPIDSRILLLFLEFLEGKCKKILEKECNRMFLKHGFSLLQEN